VVTGVFNQRRVGYLFLQFGAEGQMQSFVANFIDIFTFRIV
jgi:hypothetical protein